MTAAALVIVVVSLTSPDSCQGNYLIIISAALLCMNMNSAIRPAGAGFGGLMMVMTVNGLAVEGCKRSHDMRNAFCAACMHIESYDTQTVPYGQQQSDYFHHDILHNNLQNYKNMPIMQNQHIFPYATSGFRDTYLSTAQSVE